MNVAENLLLAALIVTSAVALFLIFLGTVCARRAAELERQLKNPQHGYADAFHLSRISHLENLLTAVVKQDGNVDTLLLLKIKAAISRRDIGGRDGG